MISRLHEKIRDSIKSNPERSTYQKEYMEYLNLQARECSAPAPCWPRSPGSTSPFSWIRSFTRIPRIVYFRMGLSAVGLIVFAATFFKSTRAGARTAPRDPGVPALQLRLLHGPDRDDPSYISGFHARHLCCRVHALAADRLVPVFHSLHHHLRGRHPDTTGRISIPGPSITP